MKKKTKTIKEQFEELYEELTDFNKGRIYAKIEEMALLQRIASSK